MAILKKINLYSTPDLKANVDENLFAVFESLGYIEDFKLIDVRLGLGIACCALSAGAFYIDKHYDFKDTVNITAAMVAVYFICSFAMRLWSKYVEKDIKFVGNRNGIKLVFKSSTNKIDSKFKYELSIGNQTIKSEVGFEKLFNKNGFLEYEELKSILSKEVGKITKKES